MQIRCVCARTECIWLPMQADEEEPWLERTTSPFEKGSFTAGNASFDVRPDMVVTPAYLQPAAEKLLAESCGEGWLLQPEIIDFERGEYRWDVSGLFR